jgi:polyhydroxybutyrate depolymerase
MNYFLLLLAIAPAAAQDLHKKISVAGEWRDYIVHVPAKFDTQKKHPLVLVFHGGGGTAKNSLAFFGINPVADTAGFIAVYPNGIKKGWNDGRPIKKHAHDDIGFIRQLIDQLSKDYPIDEKRIFATGISNGGFFSFALGLHLSDKIRAIAPVCATIPAAIFENYLPKNPPGILLINGTADPLVPYSGGKVGGKWLNRGQCMGTEQTIRKFLQLNQCDGVLLQTSIQNKDEHDGCVAIRNSYRCARNHVQLIRVEGGGHTWPGGKQYLGKKLVGRVCRDFSAAAEIWSFFRQFD